MRQTGTSTRFLAATIAILLLCNAGVTEAATADKGKVENSGKAAQPSPPAIVSIVPAQGEPEKSVTLFGSGFTAGSKAFLGNSEVPTTVRGEKQLEFDIPSLPPGLYALYVRGADGSLSKSYNFTVVAPKPVAMALEPDRVYTCATGDERSVTISGKNFAPGAQLLFDGAAIRSSSASSDSITFSAPPVPGGLHQVQVKNPDDTVSGVLGLFIESRPEIRSVTQGEDRVSDYDIIIDGINFLQTSQVVVDGKKLSPGAAMDRERVYLVDCTRIVYQRHPYDSTSKTLRIQVINPGGGESQVAQMNGP